MIVANLIGEDNDHHVFTWRSGAIHLRKFGSFEDCSKRHFGPGVVDRNRINRVNNIIDIVGELGRYKGDIFTESHHNIGEVGPILFGAISAQLFKHAVESGRDLFSLGRQAD